METSDKDEKLKDLEFSLTEELDPSKRAANDSKKQNVQKQEKPSSTILEMSEEEIAMAAMDQVINQNDPTFSEELSALKEGIVDADVQIDGSVDAGDGATADELPPPHSVEVPVTVAPEVVLSKRAKLINFFKRFGQIFSEEIIGIVELVSYVLSNFKGIFKTIISSIKKIFSEFSRMQWFLVIGFILCVTAMGYVLKKGPIVFTQLSQQQFMGTYDLVADEIVSFSIKDDLRLFKDPADDFDFIVQFKRMIVNIKPSGFSTRNPMATFVLFLEGSNRETSVELKDRESTIKDLCQRVAESLTYDEFISAEGKVRFKTALRKEINEILNQGRLRAVYFDTIIIKP